MEITDDKQTRIVHTNRLRHRIQPMQSSESQSTNTNSWTEPQVECMILPPLQPAQARRYPLYVKDVLQTISHTEARGQASSRRGECSVTH